MTDMLTGTAALGALGVALVIFGFAPGVVLALIVRLLHKDDPRRRELHAELYAVPRWERPFWVAQQMEVALREGAVPHLMWWLERRWHRPRLNSGVHRNREHPESFWIPSPEAKAALLPGDTVKLMWQFKVPKLERLWARLTRREVNVMNGERMWVRVIARDGDALIGTLDNWPVVVPMESGELVRFQLHHVIDIHRTDEDAEASS